MDRKPSVGQFSGLSPDTRRDRRKLKHTEDTNPLTSSRGSLLQSVAQNTDLAYTVEKKSTKNDQDKLIQTEQRKLKYLLNNFYKEPPREAATQTSFINQEPARQILDHESAYHA